VLDVPGILPTKFGIRRPFRFRFPSRCRHGTDRRTDRQTDGQHRYMIGPPSRKDGPIITVRYNLSSISDMQIN